MLDTPINGFASFLRKGLTFPKFYATITPMVFVKHCWQLARRTCAALLLMLEQAACALAGGGMPLRFGVAFADARGLCGGASNLLFMTPQDNGGNTAVGSQGDGGTLRGLKYPINHAKLRYLFAVGIVATVASGLIGSIFLGSDAWDGLFEMFLTLALGLFFVLFLKKQQRRSVWEAFVVATAVVGVVLLAVTVLITLLYKVVVWLIQ